MNLINTTRCLLKIVLFSQNVHNNKFKKSNHKDAIEKFILCALARCSKMAQKVHKLIFHLAFFFASEELSVHFPCQKY